MSVLIGHASIDENNKVKNGQVGDQTGKEVCIREWWDKGWNILLRPNPQYAEAIVQACQAGCKNNNIGYDQNQRNTLHNVAKSVAYDFSKISPCETDCSAFVTVCCIAAGITELEYVGNAPTTRTMRTVFKNTGKFQVITDIAYLRSDRYLKRGDILVKEGSHTVIVLENGQGVENVIAQDLSGKDIRVVAAINLNARILPNGSKLFLLNAGERVNVVQEKDGWCLIQAWVSSKYLVK